MARSKKISSTSRRQSQRAKQTQQSLAKLRKAGIIGRTEFRGKPSGRAYGIIRKYRDVVEGTAVAVKPKTRFIPKQLKKAYKERRGLLIIPKTRDTISTSVTRSKKGQVEIKRTRRTPRGLIREEVTTPSREIPPLPPGKVYRARMLNWGSESNRYFAAQKSLNDFLNYYDNIQHWMDISITDLPPAFADA